MEDINIIVNSLQGRGFAYVYYNEGKYRAVMFQNRLDLSLREEAAIEELSEGEVYQDDFDSLLEAINCIRDFWFQPELGSGPKIKEYAGIYDAIEKDPDSDFIYYTEKQGGNN